MPEPAVHEALDICLLKKFRIFNGRTRENESRIFARAPIAARCIRRLIMQVVTALVVAICIVAVVARTAFASPAVDAAGSMPKNVLGFTMKDIDGNPVSLSKYAGKVIMIVNVASKCGNTPQYKALEALYEKYRDRGFVVLGFPANNFLFQEPGTNAQIKLFCTSTYNVSFPMFSKISVKGPDIDPLYLYLTDKSTDPAFGGDIDWNFAKFLVDRNGDIVARYKAKHAPDSPDVIADIEAQLKKPAGSAGAS